MKLPGVQPFRLPGTQHLPETEPTAAERDENVVVGCDIDSLQRSVLIGFGGTRVSELLVQFRGTGAGEPI